ncbi:MAG TPA: class I tRNA ligase family protein [Desulfatiglandales bacterium]|nr:class I tRNA ligase family protein [Desulfatiglandales bacterium]
MLINLEGDSEVPSKGIVYSLPDRWILTRLGAVSGDVSRALDEYRFNDAASLCYQFVWHEFCDWYLEMIKERLYGDDESLKGSTRAVLRVTLMGILRILHPFMPFITEEIWHRLADDKGSIMYADFPAASEFLNDRKALEEMGLVMDIITTIRNIRGEMNIAPSKKVDILAEIPENSDIEIVRQNLSHIRNLAKVDSIEILREISKPEASVTAVVGMNQLHVLLKGIMDFDEEKKRLRKEIKTLSKEMEASAKKLSSKGFLENAPAEIVAGVRDKFESMKAELEKFEKNLKFFESIND